MKTSPPVAAWSFFVSSLFVQAVFAVTSKELLHLDFNDTAHLAAQPAPLPLGLVNWDATPSKDFPGAVNLGQSGFISVRGFKGPKGPFSVEALFRMNDFAPASTRFISDLLNTATWDIDTTQGVTMRVGGGYLFAPLPRQEYQSDADYNADLGWYDDSERASISKCIGEFVTAIKGDNRNWKEVVTERCIPLNTWVHMVGVYDGADLSLYLNGQYATDTTRMLGRDKTPHFADTATAFLGARTSGEFDSRHFNGSVDYVRVVDSAMGIQEIRTRYRAALHAQNSDTLCYGSIVPEYPHAGQAANEQTKFSIRIVADGACMQPGFKPNLQPGDSVEVEIASDAEFSNILVRMVVSQTTFTIDPKYILALEGFHGDAFWRARILKAAPAMAKASASRVLDWGLARPVLLNLQKPTVALQPRVRAQSRMLVSPGALIAVPAKGNLAPGLWTIAGARSPLAWSRAGDRWMARVPESGESRVLILGWE